GLAAAHASGLVHRDFKPSNVLVGRDGRVRVSDFGLVQTELAPDASAGGARPELELTMAGELVGTPFYMAPEQFRGEAADPRSDQFSFCVALYRALYRKQPFPGATLEELDLAVTSGLLQPPPPSAKAPRWLGRAVVRGLAVDPDARFPSMDALLGAL